MKKRSLFCFAVFIFIALLFIFSKSNIASAKEGLILWVNSIIPSLFPFFVATELLSYTNISFYLGKLFGKIMMPIFNVPGEGAYPFIMGILCGYPIGAKIVAKQKENGILTLAQSERLLAFTNNSGPLFIIGSVGICMFGNIKIGIILLATHILACLSVGFLFRFWKRKEKEQTVLFLNNTNYNLSNNLGEIFYKSISNSINSILIIGGFIVIFSVIISILENLNFSPFFMGLLELTNGLNKLATSGNIYLSSFILGFGGLCVAMQVYSITYKAKIPIKSYLIGKFLQGTFAFIYTYLFLHFWFAT